MKAKLNVRRIITIIAVLALLSIAALQVEGPSDAVAKIIGLIITVVVGFLGRAPLQWIKEKFGWVDDRAFLLLWVVSLVFAVAALAITGELMTFPLVWENVLLIGTMVYTAAQYAYQRLKARNGG